MRSNGNVTRFCGWSFLPKHLCSIVFSVVLADVEAVMPCCS